MAKPCGFMLLGGIVATGDKDADDNDDNDDDPLFSR